MGRPKYLPTSILIAFAVETFTVTWLLKRPGWVPWLSFFYFASGAAIALLLLRFPVVSFPSPGRRAWRLPVNQYRLIVTGLVGLMLYSWALYWFDEMPIDITNADMLPIIRVMGDRFIAGQHSHIYDIIPSIWKGTQPIYLPAMWLPYVPAIALGIDMRWVNITALLFAFGAFIFIYRPTARGYISFFLGVLAFLFFWWVVADNTPGIISVAEEGVVIAYYILLVLALISGRPWLTAIAASLCMLSRYSFIGWIPAYIVWLVLGKKWRHLAIFIGTGALCFVLLFLVPVGWSTFIRLARLPGSYIAFAARVWHDSPDVFRTAPSFAYFFGPKRIALLHGLLVSLTFAVPVVFVLVCYARIKAGKIVNNVPLAALKMGLVFFYCFIDVPYLYLFYTSSFISLIIIALLLREGEPGSPRYISGC